MHGMFVVWHVMSDKFIMKGMFVGTYRMFVMNNMFVETCTFVTYDMFVGRYMFVSYDMFVGICLLMNSMFVKT